MTRLFSARDTKCVASQFMHSLIIVLITMQCMHPDCPDYDLCQDCEALPIAVHPSTHTFLKIKRGDVGIPSVKRNSPRSPKVSLADLPRSAVIPIPAVSVDAADTRSTPAVKAAPAVSPPHIERLHAIRAQAERRLSARMQQLQSYPFSDGSATPTVDPVIEERLLRERKEAEEKARIMDKEIEELEKARRRKHNDERQQPSSPHLESVSADFADTTELHRILKVLNDCLGTTDSYVVSLTY